VGGETVLEPILLEGRPLLPGDRVIHVKGNVYKVVCTALTESELAPVVIYSGPDGTIWSRPGPEFVERFFRALPREGE
jgi:hypothetical protein